MSTALYNSFIGGDWIAATAQSQNINSSDITDIVGDYAQANAAQAVSAITVAKTAQPTLGGITPQHRFNVLDFIGSEILARKDELGRLLSREEGKTLPGMVKGRVPGTSSNTSQAKRCMLVESILPRCGPELKSTQCASSLLQ